MRKERITELELVRSFAFLAVVYQHVIGIYIRVPGIDEQTAVVYGMLFHLLKFAVPAFVFITGLVLFYNYYENISYFEFMRKRTMEILVPYLLWSGIYLSLQPGFPPEGSSVWWSLAKNLGTGTASYHLWFVVMIFQFYLLYPFWQQVFRFLRRYADSMLKLAGVILLLAIGYSLLMWFSARYIPANSFWFNQAWLDTYLIKYRDRNAFYYFYYFLFGGLVAVALPVFRAKIKQHWIWICTSFLILYAYIGYELFRDSGYGMINLNVATSLKPSMFVYTLAQLLVVYGIALALLKHPRICFWMTKIGQYSYGAYLIHALVLTYVMQFLRSISLFHEGILGSLVAFGLCAMLSFGIAFACSKLPFGWLLVGSAKKKKPKAVPFEESKDRKKAM